MATTVCPAAFRRRRRPARSASRCATVEERLADGAAASGFFETVQYPFVDRDSDEAAWGDWLRITETALEPLAILNPLDGTRRHLRATLLPGLLDALARNIRRGAEGAALFEIGRAFGEAGESDRPESYESRRFAFALAGELRSALERAGEAARLGLLRCQGAGRARPVALAPRDLRCGGSRPRSRR